jgi:hypothetical protein
MKAFDLLIKKKKTKKKTKKQNQSIKYWFLSLAIFFSLIFLLFLYLVLEPTIYKNKPLPNIWIAGISVSINSSSKLASKIDSKIQKYQSENKFRVNFENSNWEVLPNTDFVGFDKEKSAQEAIGYGKTGKFSHQLWARLKLLFAKQKLPLFCEIQNQKYQEFLDQVKKDVEYPYQNASLKFEGLNLINVDSKQGLLVDEEKLQKSIDSNIRFLKTETVILKTKKTSPKITQKDTESARKKALTFISSDIKITYKEKETSYEPSEIVKWIAFSEATDNLENPVLKTKLDETKVKNSISPKIGNIETSPENVKVVFENGKLVVTQASKLGYGINYTQLLLDLDKNLQKSENRKISLKLETIKPEISENNLDNLGIKELIS